MSKPITAEWERCYQSYDDEVPQLGTVAQETNQQHWHTWERLEAVTELFDVFHVRQLHVYQKSHSDIMPLCGSFSFFHVSLRWWTVPEVLCLLMEAQGWASASKPSSLFLCCVGWCQVEWVLSLRTPTAGEMVVKLKEMKKTVPPWNNLPLRYIIFCNLLSTPPKSPCAAGTPYWNICISAVSGKSWITNWSPLLLYCSWNLIPQQSHWISSPASSIWFSRNPAFCKSSHSHSCGILNGYLKPIQSAQLYCFTLQ